MAVSPTQRALAHCRKQGWIAQVVEHWNQYANIRQDLFGVIDLIVLDGEGGGPLGVQVTSGSNVSSRIHKAQEEPRLRAWIDSPARFEVWGYRKLAVIKKDGKKGKAKRWELRRITMSAEEVAAE